MNIIKENETIDLLLQGNSIARFGDGELRVACGGSVGHQKVNKKLQEELLHILQKPTKCLVGIPYVHPHSPKKYVWEHYAPKFQHLYNHEKQYYSSFITRPDSAPWIDNMDYWQRARSLWENKEVIVISGSKKGFRPEELKVKSIQFIQARPEEAYQDIDFLEKEAGNDISKVVLLAVGITATVLAWRLSEKGFQALDLGHLPMFIRRKGLFA